jgi:hypothetical protein
MPILQRLCFGGSSEKLLYVQDEYIAVIVELPVEAVGDGCCDGLVENPRGVQVCAFVPWQSWRN